MTAEERVLGVLLRRVDMWHRRFEATGDEKFARLAADADARYLRARAYLGES